MITINGYSGAKCQMFYLAHIIGGAAYIVHGPFVYDHDMGGAALSTAMDVIDYGRPVNVPIADNLVDLLVGDIDAVHGQHSCSHRNAKGSLTFADPSFNPSKYPRFEFRMASDSDSILTQSGWWFNVNKASTVKNWSFSSQIGYTWGGSSASASSSMPIAAGLPCYRPGSSGTFKRYTIRHQYAFPAGIVGDYMWEATADNGTHNLYQHSILSYSYPNKITYVRRRNGVVEYSGSGTMVIVPVTATLPVSWQNQLPTLEGILSTPFNYCTHCDIASGTLAHNAVDSINYIKSNSLENIQGWKSVKENAPPLKALRNLKSPKGIAELYLWYKYSFKPNVHDVPEVLRGMQNFFSAHKKNAYFTKYATLYASKTSPFGHVMTRGNLRVRYHPRAVTQCQDLYFKLKTLGLAPTPDMLWDLVPFSFVVDWFAPIGDKLSDATFSFEAKMNMYDVYDVIDSRKTVLTVDASRISSLVIGSITYSVYNRQVSSSLPADTFQYGSKDPSNHVLEGSALVVANW